jgi:hypothetical protein
MTGLLDFRRKTRQQQIQDKWEKNHREKPEIYLKFRSQLDRLRAMGRKHYSARTVLEWIRHETDLRGHGSVKINDHWTPYYARLYMRDRDCPGFLETRKMKSADRPAYAVDMDVAPIELAVPISGLDALLDELLDELK